jgi:hypothetical protein
MEDRINNKNFSNKNHLKSNSSYDFPSNESYNNLEVIKVGITPGIKNTNTYKPFIPKIDSSPGNNSQKKNFKNLNNNSHQSEIVLSRVSKNQDRKEIENNFNIDMSRDINRVYKNSVISQMENNEIFYNKNHDVPLIKNKLNTNLHLEDELNSSLKKYYENLDHLKIEDFMTRKKMQDQLLQKINSQMEKLNFGLNDKSYEEKIAKEWVEARGNKINEKF